LASDDPALGAGLIFVGPQMLVATSPHNDNVGGADAGAAYVFERIGGTWTETQKLLKAGQANANNLLGKSAASDGTTLALGANGGFWGGVTFFNLQGGTWVEGQSILAGGATPLSQFGESLSIDGDRLVVGSTHDTNSSPATLGAAYVFERSGGTWSQIQRLAHPDPATSGSFGQSVAIEGDAIVIGTGSPSSRAYVYRWVGASWQLQTTLLSPATQQSEYFGFQVGLENGTALVAAPRHTPNGDLLDYQAGSLFLFQ